MKVILINATAARSSGALTILKDCIAYLESNQKDDTEYHLFTVVNNFDVLSNVHVHKLKPQNWFYRIQWDNGGLQKWCRSNNLEPDIIFSLQNTSTKYRNRDGLMIINVVYYHQPIPLIKYKWNGLSLHEYKMWLYTYFYPFFVNRNNTTTKYIVQLPYIKELFLKRFKNIKEDRVFIVKPNIPRVELYSVRKIVFEKEYVFIYPATLLRYKNHTIIIDALILLSQIERPILDKIEAIFTIDSLSKALQNKIAAANIQDCIHCVGVKPYDELLTYYNSATALLFPSVIESFGLPLQEAAAFGAPISASVLPYAHEVLENYTNVQFADPYNAKQWADFIRNAGNYKHTIPLKDSVENSWEKIFKIVKNIN
jgi:glycosyltransferase involved in cell wall biosynthesis